MLELPQETTRSIKALCEQAYIAYDEGDYKKALRTFYQGWLLVPKPQTDFQESGWLLIGIGDTYYKLSQFVPACEALRSANHCPEVKENPFIHMRLGQCLYHLGEERPTKFHLLKAYAIGGMELFTKEQDIYFQFIGPYLPLSDDFWENQRE